IGLYSFSKSFCIPGHRVAAITAGESVVEAVAKIMDNVQICAPRAAQMALAKALPALADWCAENRAEIARRRVALIAAVAQNPDWQIGAIGAYFAFLRHPWPERTSLDVAQQLATQNGIITIPGRFFGADQDEWLRLAFANADAPTLATLADRLRD
ncbi:MAG TPA: aminotransferase class I/II-fold pyridoxal phosphate-dependent enzyme, partial [Aestuariivirga sp.]|nr:aminotransferase class I/II-fold pyridoxal phosphate-dependent enzyme [Aestuariivirga sp.]